MSSDKRLQGNGESHLRLRLTTCIQPEKLSHTFLWALIKVLLIPTQNSCRVPLHREVTQDQLLFSDVVLPSAALPNRCQLSHCAPLRVFTVQCVPNRSFVTEMICILYLHQAFEVISQRLSWLQLLGGFCCHCFGLVCFLKLTFDKHESIKYLTGISEVIIICLAAPLPRLIPHTRFLQFALHLHLRPKRLASNLAIQGCPQLPSVSGSTCWPLTVPASHHEDETESCCREGWKILKAHRGQSRRHFPGKSPQFLEPSIFFTSSLWCLSNNPESGFSHLLSLLCHVHIIISEQP